MSDTEPEVHTPGEFRRFHKFGDRGPCPPAAPTCRNTHHMWDVHCSCGKRIVHNAQAVVRTAYDQHLTDVGASLVTGRVYAR